MATINFPQVSESAAKSKMKRLVGNTVYGQIGFCNVALKRTSIDEARQYGPTEWWIELSSTYHVDETMENMYKSNGKNW